MVNFADVSNESSEDHAFQAMVKPHLFRKPKKKVNGFLSINGTFE